MAQRLYVLYFSTAPRAKPVAKQNHPRRPLEGEDGSEDCVLCTIDK